MGNFRLKNIIASNINSDQEQGLFDIKSSDARMKIIKIRPNTTDHRQVNPSDELSEDEEST